MSALPKISIKELMDAGVHFGHRTMRWNPKMSPFIYGARNNIHIIDLQKTAPLLHTALKVASDVAARNGRILFVATKRQATNIVAEAAEKCGQYYVNYRWMGGMLTNWGTVSKSIKTLNEMETQLNDENLNLNKKERLQISRKINKLEQALGGIRKMGGKPDLLIVLDTNREKIAIQEAKKLGIPVIAVVDTNSNPDNIDYIVPGNDDSIKSIRKYCDMFSEAILGGISQSVGSNTPKAANDAEEGEAKEEAIKAIEAEDKKSTKKATEDTTKTSKTKPKEEKVEDKKKDEKPKKKPAKDEKKEPAKKKAAPKKTAAKKSTAKDTSKKKENLKDTKDKK